MKDWPFIDRSMAMLFGFPFFDNGNVYIIDPACEDSMWKNASASAFNFPAVQAKLKGLFEELKRLEKEHLQQELPTVTTDLFRRLFERV
jgi:hypothetical protein